MKCRLTELKIRARSNLSYLHKNLILINNFNFYEYVQLFDT